MDSVIAALTALYGPEQAARGAANQWLQDYQKQTEAWTTSNVLLTSQDAPTEAKLFAAQTFRSKITYDLNDLAPEHRLALRDSLRNALKASNLSMVVIRQIALALADLLLQMPEWQTAISDLVEELGADASSAAALLEFLTVLPEEAETNGRVETTNEDILTHKNASVVMNLLPNYVGAQIPAKLRKQAFLCFASWLRAGVIPASVTAASPLFATCFDCLASDDLYEEASAAVVDLIHETQEVDDNVAVIQQIIPRLIALKPSLSSHADDFERIRALCKVYAEAGEVYTPLIVKHLSDFYPVVEAIAECSRNPELDVVRLTFGFWWKMSEATKVAAAAGTDVSPLYMTFAALIDDIVKHLRYPADSETPMTAQERDDFREFRHQIGDTLKDCGSVLGAIACLKRVNELVKAALATFETTGSWQAVEAPLFSIRAIGSAIDPNDDEVMPGIMDTLQKLPSHPRIRYAAILVIARYTEWIERHPQHIPFQLTFISAGFSDADTDVWLASAQAMKFLCQDCRQHLIPYVPQLHAFIENLGPKLPPEDLGEVSEGIAHVISSMPPDQLVQALPLFCLPILESIKTLIPKDLAKSKPDQLALDDTLMRLAKYLEICSSRSIELPAACTETAAEAWVVMDELFLRHGHLRGVAENGCTVLRRSIDFFGDRLLPISPRVASRLATAFSASGRAAYLWITGHLTSLASRSQSPELNEALRLAFETESAKVFEILPQAPLAENEDVVDDYCHLLPSLLRYTPDILLLSSSLRGAMAVAVSALSLLNAQVVRIGLDVLLDLYGHDCLERSRAATPQSTALRNALQAEGPTVIKACVGGIISEWEDTTSAVTLCRITAERFSQEFLSWVQAGLQDVPGKALGEADRGKFLQELTGAMTRGDLNGVRNAFQQLDRLSRRAKLRAAMDRRRSELDA